MLELSLLEYKDFTNVTFKTSNIKHNHKNKRIVTFVPVICLVSDYPFRQGLYIESCTSVETWSASASPHIILKGGSFFAYAASHIFQFSLRHKT